MPVMQHTAKWGGQNGAMIFQTRSRFKNRKNIILLLYNIDKKIFCLYN